MRISTLFSLLFPVFITGPGQCHPMYKLEDLATAEQRDYMLDTYITEFFQESKPIFPADQSLAFFKQTNSSELSLSPNLLVTSVDFSRPLTMAGATELLVTNEEKRHHYATSQEVNKAHLKAIFANEVLGKVRNHIRDSKEGTMDKSFALAYLVEKIGNFALNNLVVGLQGFIPKIFIDSITNDNRLQNVAGTNIMALIPGEFWGTEKDELLIVGAHWDTVENSEGFDDNTSGIAAILELIRAIHTCKFKYSIIIVAFDLEEFGSQGSEFFVNGFLIPEILSKFNYPKVQAVIILDSLMSFNETRGSQRIDHDFLGLVNNDFGERKGDFIATLARRKDRGLAEIFEHFWDRNSEKRSKNARKIEKIRRNSDKKDKYRLEKFELSDERFDEIEVDFELAKKYSNFLRSDHTRFWFVDTPIYKASFNAILVTDTGPARGVMDICYHEQCDSRASNATLSFAELEMLAKVTQTMIDLVVNLGDAKCDGLVNEYSPDKEHRSDHFSYEMRMKSPKEKES